MDKKNLPDLSLEKDILNKLELSEEEKVGAEKFLEAVSGFRNVEEGLDDVRDDLLPKPSDNVITDPQSNAIALTLTEYLNSYVLVGYDLGGNRINIYNLPSQMSADAILENLKNVFEECKMIGIEGGIMDEE